MTADLAYIWHWSPREAFDLTATELVWWLEQTNRILTRERAARE